MNSGISIKNSRFIMTLLCGLAAPTNHSLGEVVYKKVTILRSEDQPSEAVPPLPPSDNVLKVIRVQKYQGRLTVMLQHNQDLGLQVGVMLEAKRSAELPMSEGTLPIPVALLKATEVKPGYILADVVADGSPDSLMHFPDFPGIMIGDEAVAQGVEIVQRVRLAPAVSLQYKQLFVDPKGLPSTMEMSPEGRALITEQARQLADLRAPLLIVEAHTGTKGDRRGNQLESYQRALIIRQVLIQELGIDPERILAIGMGESEPLNDDHLPGNDDEARRIVLKIKNPP